MRRVIITSLVLALVAFAGSILSPTGATQATNRETALVDFPQQVKLLGVFLKGEYLIVHDDASMAQGGDCTFVYSRREGQPDKLVASFHCTPVARNNADHFVVRTARLSGLIETPEIREIQFAGSNEGHQVPTE
jgi:hypothetical protein